MTDHSALRLEPAQTALVLVDLQNFTVALPTTPLSGKDVLANAIRLADACRSRGVLVVLVRVGYGDSGPLQLRLDVDAPFGGFSLSPEDLEIPPELGPRPGDVVVDKYNWGSFYGTNLDLQLRRRGITTLIVGGLVTNFGVDTTLRHANERGYNQILALDATAAFSLAEHEYVLQTIAPRLSRVRPTALILEALGAP